MSQKYSRFFTNNNINMAAAETHKVCARLRHFFHVTERHVHRLYLRRERKL